MVFRGGRVFFLCYFFFQVLWLFLGICNKGLQIFFINFLWRNIHYIKRLHSSFKRGTVSWIVPFSFQVEIICILESLLILNIFLFFSPDFLNEFIRLIVYRMLFPAIYILSLWGFRLFLSCNFFPFLNVLFYLNYKTKFHTYLFSGVIILPHTIFQLLLLFILII